jgi:hypothetical protein
MYVIQEIDLTTKKPLPDFEIWPEYKKKVVLEFQNAENSTVRISRMTHEPSTAPAGQPPGTTAEPSPP